MSWWVIVSIGYSVGHLFGWLVLKQPKWVIRKQMWKEERCRFDFHETFGIQANNHFFDLFVGLTEWDKIFQGLVNSVLTVKARLFHEACEGQASAQEKQRNITGDNPAEEAKKNEEDVKSAGEKVKQQRKDFWTAHALAKSFSYKVHPKHTDYLKKEKQVPASA